MARSSVPPPPTPTAASCSWRCGVARRMLGRTAPNPAVGAVIADEATGEVIARGWTQPGGRPHAEAHALARAGARARGQTMYVTLEPCSHHGRTPPVRRRHRRRRHAPRGVRHRGPQPGDLRPRPRRAAQRRRRRRPRPVRGGGALDGGRPHPAHDQGPPVRAAEDRRVRRRPDRARRRRPALGHGPGGAPASRTSCARAPMPSWSAARRLPTTTPSSPAACRAWQARSPRRVVLDAKFRTPPDARMFADGRARAGDDLRRHRQHAAALSQGRGGAPHAGRRRRPLEPRGRAREPGRGGRHARAGRGRADHCRRLPGRGPRRRGGDRARHRGAGRQGPQAGRRSMAWSSWPTPSAGRRSTSA